MKKLFVFMMAIFVLCGCKVNQSDTASLVETDGKSFYLFASVTKSGTDLICRFTCSRMPNQQNKKDLCTSPAYIKQSELENTEYLSGFLKYIKSKDLYFRTISEGQTKVINALYPSSSEDEYISDIGTAEEVCEGVLGGSQSAVVGETSAEEGSSEEESTDIVGDEYKCYKTVDEICEIEAAIFKETNAYRRRVGLREFKPSLSVSYAARDWSSKQARRGYIGHEGFSGSRWNIFSPLRSIKFLDAGLIRGLSRENVAMNYVRTSTEATGKAFTNQWLNSSGHLANIRASSTYLGVGVAKARNGAYYATQIFAY